MDRRSFVKNMAILSAAGNAGLNAVWAAEEDINATRIPHWRGFNLQGKFDMPDRPYEGRAFEEFDVATMVEWGFNFARLPLSYWVWGSREDWSIVREEPLKEIDRAIELGRQYEIHVNLNFHRIPGYCINLRELEPADLFSGTKAQRDKAMAAAIFHWKAFARRYKAFPTVV
jgi:endoglucanase